MLCERAVLNEAVCATLRAALDTNGTGSTDSVDGLREHVLYLSAVELEATIGGEAMRRLLTLPLRFRDVVDSDGGGGSRGAGGGARDEYVFFDCFLRRYSSGTLGEGGGDDQLLTSFHADAAALTVNVALTSDTDHEGGTLLGLYGGEVRAVLRGCGDATVHSSALLHGVTRMRAGVRYSMILFFARGTR